MPAPHHSSFLTGWMPFLPPNQQRQSTEGKYYYYYYCYYYYIHLMAFFPGQPG